MPVERCVKLIPFFMQYKKHLLMIGAIAAAIIFYFLNKQPTTPLENPLQSIDPQPMMTNDTTAHTADTPTQPETSIAVDIKGAVKKPGVYEVQTSDRVYDAIMAAGGYKDNADRNVINHAAHVKDEMVIYVPKKGEKLDNVPFASSTTTNEGATSSTQRTAENTVNINTADEAGLQTINGIGPAKAKAIIQYRLENGPFQTVDDLKNVSGIGDKTLEQLRPFITVQ